MDGATKVSRSATRGHVHAPGSVPLTPADVGYLWGIRTEVVAG
jgi:hypothetical protein